MLIEGWILLAILVVLIFTSITVTGALRTLVQSNDAILRALREQANSGSRPSGD